MVDVQHRHLRAHAHSDARRIRPYRAGAENCHTGRRYPRDAPHQHPAPAVILLQKGRADLGRHPARYLTHRHE